MSTDLTRRFNALKGAVESKQLAVSKIEAQMEMKQNEFRAKKEELAELGIEFSNPKELKAMIEDKEERITQMVTQMEQSLGISNVDDAIGDLDIIDEDDFAF